MTTPIPDYVDRVLREWDTIALFSYDNFESSGRGAVAIGDYPEGPRIAYAAQDYFVGTQNRQVLQLLYSYDPETEILAHFGSPTGMRTLRVRTPPEGKNPKRIWFFEMLRSLEEEPEKMPDPLPDWFAQALDKLHQMKKDKP